MRALYSLFLSVLLLTGLTGSVWASSFPDCIFDNTCKMCPINSLCPTACGSDCPPYSPANSCGMSAKTTYLLNTTPGLDTSISAQVTLNKGTGGVSCPTLNNFTVSSSAEVPDINLAYDGTSYVSAQDAAGDLVCPDTNYWCAVTPQGCGYSCSRFQDWVPQDITWMLLDHLAYWGRDSSDPYAFNYEHRGTLEWGETLNNINSLPANSFLLGGDLVHPDAYQSGRSGTYMDSVSGFYMDPLVRGSYHTFHGISLYSIEMTTTYHWQIYCPLNSTNYDWTEQQRFPVPIGNPIKGLFSWQGIGDADFQVVAGTPPPAGCRPKIDVVCPDGKPIDRARGLCHCADGVNFPPCPAVSCTKDSECQDASTPCCNSGTCGAGTCTPCSVTCANGQLPDNTCTCPPPSAIPNVDLKVLYKGVSSDATTADYGDTVGLIWTSSPTSGVDKINACYITGQGFDSSTPWSDQKASPGVITPRLLDPGDYSIKCTTASGKTTPIDTVHVAINPPPVNNLTVTPDGCCTGAFTVTWKKPTLPNSALQGPTGYDVTRMVDDGSGNPFAGSSSPTWHINATGNESSSYVFSYDDHPPLGDADALTPGDMYSYQITAYFPSNSGVTKITVYPTLQPAPTDASSCSLCGPCTLTYNLNPLVSSKTTHYTNTLSTLTAIDATDPSEWYFDYTFDLTKSGGIGNRSLSVPDNGIKVNGVTWTKDSSSSPYIYYDPTDPQNSTDPKTGRRLTVQYCKWNSGSGVPFKSCVNDPVITSPSSTSGDLKAQQIIRIGVPYSSTPLDNENFYKPSSNQSVDITVIDNSPQPPCTVQSKVLNLKIAPPGGCAGALTGNCSASVNSGDPSNKTVDWNAHVNNSTVWPLTYAWTGDVSLTDIVASDDDPQTKTYGNYATRSVTVNVRDTNACTGTFTCSFTPPKPPMTVSCSASGGPFAVGSPVNWTGLIKDGVAPYTFKWSGDDGFFADPGPGSPGSSDPFTVPNAPFTYSAGGNKNATLIVTDSSPGGGLTASATCSAFVASVTPPTVCGKSGTVRLHSETYIAPKNGCLEIDTEGSDYNTVLGVTTSKNGNTVKVACNDDCGADVDPNLPALGKTSKVIFPTKAGTIYTVDVGNYPPSPANTTQVNYHYMDDDACPR